MADWDSADLLARCRRAARLPATSEFPADADWYAWLTEAEAHWKGIFAVHVPESQIRAATLVTSTDGGYTYTLPTYPLGGVELRSGRSGPVLVPGADFDPGADFVINGQSITFPGGVARSFGGGLYARYVDAPASINAGTGSTIQPPHARALLVWRACVFYASNPKSGIDPGYFEAQETGLAWDDPTTGKTGIITSLKSQYLGQGYTSSQPVWWWQSRDLGNLNTRLS